MLHKELDVGGDPFRIIDGDVRLSLFSPGRAFFVVASSEKLSGIVKFSFGYQLDKMQRFFIGYIESSITIDNKQQKIFCKELTATLNRRIGLNLRNVTLSETLSAISENTGLDFIVPDEQYSKIKVPMFYSMASGYHCMDSLRKVFSIPQMIWQQQGNGSVYVGSWLHSFWADRQPNVPDEWHDNHGVVGSSRVPAFPMLRPGLFLNGDKYLTEVHLDGVHMNIKWSEDPWKDSLRR